MSYQYKPKAPPEVLAKRKAFADYLAKKYPMPPKKAAGADRPGRHAGPSCE